MNMSMNMDAIFSNPYVGPRPFEIAEKDLFFGRDSETRRLASLVIAQRAILLYSGSGVGKSSLLHAGVIPRLMGKGYFLLGPARVSGSADEDDNQNIANIFSYNILQRLAGQGKEVHGQDTLEEYLARLTEAQDLHNQPTVLVIDQLEELFTHHFGRRADRPGFFKQLNDALNACSSADPLLDRPEGRLFGRCSLRIIMAIREEYLAQLEPYFDILPELRQNRFRLEPLAKSQALAAVQMPPAKIGVTLEPAFAQELVDELARLPSSADLITDANEDAVEPVQLQVVCSDMWELLAKPIRNVQRSDLPKNWTVEAGLGRFYDRAIGYALGKSLFTEAGRLSGLIDRLGLFAIRIRDKLARRTLSEARLRRWFNERLITPVRTRAPVLAQAETIGIPGEVVTRLKQRYVLRVERRAGADWLEISHDRLIEPIRRSNIDWLNQHKLNTVRLGVAGLSALLLVTGYFALRKTEEQPINRLSEAEFAAHLSHEVPDLGLLLAAYDDSQLRQASSQGGSPVLASMSAGRSAGKISVADQIARETELLAYLRHKTPIKGVWSSDDDLWTLSGSSEVTKWSLADSKIKQAARVEVDQRLRSCLDQQQHAWKGEFAAAIRDDGLMICDAAGEKFFPVDSLRISPAKFAIERDGGHLAIIGCPVQAAPGAPASPRGPSALAACEEPQLGLWRITGDQLEPIDKRILTTNKGDGTKDAETSPHRKYDLAITKSVVAVVTCDAEKRPDKYCGWYSIKVYPFNKDGFEDVDERKLGIGADLITAIAITDNWIAVGYENRKDPDGGRVRVIPMAASQDKGEKIAWLPDGTRFLRVPNGGPPTLAFDRTGRFLSAGGPAHYAIVWDLTQSFLPRDEVRNLSECPEKDPCGQATAGNFVYFTRASDHVIVASTTLPGLSADGLNCLSVWWDQFKGRSSWPCTEAPIAFNGRGWRTVSASDNGDVIAASGYAFASQRRKEPFAIARRTGEYHRVAPQPTKIEVDPSSVAVAPSGKFIAWGVDAGRIYLWNRTRDSNDGFAEVPIEAINRECVRLRAGSFAAHRVAALTISPDEMKIVAADSDGCVTLYERSDLTDDSWSRKWQYDSQGLGALAASISPDGRYLAVAHMSGKLLVWDLLRAETQRPAETQVQTPWVTSIAWVASTNDAHLIGLNARWGPVGLYFVRSSESSQVSLEAVLPNTWLQPRGTASLAADSRGSLYALGTEGNLIRLKIPKTGDEVSRYIDSITCRLAATAVAEPETAWREVILSALGRAPLKNGEPLRQASISQLEIDQIRAAWTWSRRACENPKARD